MSVSTFYPDPGTGATTVDGPVARFIAAGEDWAVIRGGAGTFSSATATGGTSLQTKCDTNTDKWDGFRRAIFTFDTSALGSGASISDAVFSWWVTQKTDNFTDSIALVASTPASDNALVNADFSQLGSVLFAPLVAVSAISTGAYNGWTMNAAGIAAVVKDGITKLGTLTEIDRSDSEPPWSSGDKTELKTEFADAAGTDEDPKLVVTFTTGGTTHQVTFAITAVNVVGLQRKPTLVFDTTAVAVVGFTRKVAKTLNTTAVTVIGLLRKTSKTFATTAVAVTGFTRKVSKTFATIAVTVIGFSSTRIVRMTFAIIAVAQVGFTRKVTRVFPVVATVVVGIGKRIRKTFAVIVKAVIGFAHDGDVVPPWDLDASLHLEGQAITRHAIENQAITRHTTEQQAMVRHDIEQLS